MKDTHFFLFFSLIILFLFSSRTSYAQPELVDNGNLNDVGLDGFLNVWEGAYKEYKIPSNPEFDYVRFYVKGGDGGTATVGSNSAQGGDGATIEFNIKIGNGADEIPAGTILRFVVGKKGQDHIVNSVSTAISGGGGGTGILLKANDGTFSVPLAIAGGGGGAKRRPSGGANGQGGRAGEDGGDGDGDYGVEGGTGGYTPTDNEVVGGNGGAWFDGYTEGIKSGGRGIDGINCWGGIADEGGNGGYGCGGGGGGGTDLVGAVEGAGGGGGYSGGGSSGCEANTCGAGGGGSYLDTTYPYDEVISAGGATSPSSYGHVYYQFFCSATFTATPSIIQDAFCYSTESIELNVKKPKFWCDEVSYKRVDNSEMNTTGIFTGLFLGQSYDFELLYAGEVVDTYTHTVGSDTDTEDPLIICTNNSFVFDLNDDLNPTLTLDDISLSISDNCGIDSTTIVGYGSSRTFSCDDLGTNTLTIRTWDHIGNTTFCSVDVEIIGGYPNSSTPMMLDLDIYLDANGEATLSESDLLFFSNLETACFTRAEAEANYSVPVAYQNLDCDDVGTFSFFLEEADSNFPDAEQTINVIDPIPITASVANITVSLDASGVANLSVEDLTFTVSDNCYTDAEIIATYSVPSEFSMFDCMDIGTFSVTLDKSDSSFPGITFQVTVESSELSFPSVSTDFCSNSSFDLTTLEEDITTASGTFTYTQAIERLYIPNFNDHNVSVIDLNTNSIIQNIGVGTNPWGVGVRPDGKKVYTANYGSSDISVIDVATNTLEATIGVGQLPIGIAFNSDGSRLYVTNSLDSDVSIINTTTNTVINTISVGPGPWGIALSPDDSKIYVAEEGGNTLGVFNAATGANITSIPVQRNPKGLAISADGTKVYVGCESKLFPNEIDGAISIIDISTDLLIQTLDIDYKESIVLAVHPGGDIYAGHDDTGSGIISRITPSNLITHYTIEAGIYNNIRGISLNEDGSRLYISGSAEDKVIIFNTLTNTEMTTIAVGDSPISTGNFYVKTTIDITSPSSYIPSEGSIINVAFDGGSECESTTTITFTEAYTPVDLLGILTIVEADSLFNHADTIQTMGTVEVEANDEIIFEAAEVVLLQEGFHAKAGSVFTARIRVCGEGSESSAEKEEVIEKRSEAMEMSSEFVQTSHPEISKSLEVSIAPNPFSNETTIQFHLVKTSDVVLTITDMNGRIVDQQQYLETPEGWQQHQFDGSNLSNGMYFLHIRSQEQQIVKQLIIQK